MSFKPSIIINSHKENQQLQEAMKQIKHKIMIMSNKGGVGKSTITAILSRILAEKGYSVGILDADMHGPSQAKLFKLDRKRVTVNQHEKLLPLESSEGIRILTTAGLIENENQALIWRGPLKIGLIRQFLRDTEWGEGLDYLLIDSPPGTGDEPLTIGQLIPDLDGMVIVTTSQDMALIDTRKAINFAKQLKVPIIGLIENMSVFKCPHCKQEIDLFNAGGSKKVAEDFGVEVIAEVPYERGIMEAGELGKGLYEESVDKETLQQFYNVVSKIENHVRKKVDVE